MLNEIKELLQSSANNVRMSQDVDRILNEMDTMNDEFFRRITLKYPKLTSNEKQLLGLIRTKTKAKDIASIKGISTKSLEMSRYRLKKKLQLGSETNLDQFIEGF
tara:strand:- start:1269 stop:1583 length:315 start_codon:yes stop_codon:yes gene_type:complete